MLHKSVLLQQAIDGLDIKAGDIFVDGTLGNGGHSEEVIKRFGTSVKIFAIDTDVDAITRAKERLDPLGGDVTYILGNFRNIDTLLKDNGVEMADPVVDFDISPTEVGPGQKPNAKIHYGVDKILLDIGMSSNQLEESARGFSFKMDEPLNMSFKKELGEEDYTAETIVNTWDEDSIRTIIKAYGEEKFAGRIAKTIIRTRELTPIKTTTDLVNVILSATPQFYHRQRLHPATRTFQALRITVNDELQALQEGTEKGFHILNKGGRIAVISFHSLEDRIVKTYFKTLDATGFGTKTTKKPIIPTEGEINENPRARSAKLRIIEKN